MWGSGTTKGQGHASLRDWGRTATSVSEKQGQVWRFFGVGVCQGDLVFSQGTGANDGPGDVGSGHERCTVWGRPPRGPGPAQHPAQQWPDRAEIKFAAASRLPSAGKQVAVRYLSRKSDGLLFSGRTLTRDKGTHGKA